MKKYRIFEKYFLNTFFSVPFWLGCILTTLTCYLTLQFQADYRASAVFEFRMIHDKAQSFLTLIPGVYGATLVYYRDIKDQNYKNVVSRIPLRTYVRTQTVVCAACTWLISVLGNMLFIVTYGNVYGWYDVREDAVMLNELFRGFLPEHMMIYFLLSAMQLALLSVIISQIALTISVGIPQLAIIFSLPVGICYFMGILARGEMLDPHNLFLGGMLLFQNAWLHLFFVLGLTILVTVIGDKISYLLWYWRVHYV